jgi:predicted ATPase/DNA-binding winged helix-turn-helix (wHTH) protein
METGAGAMPDTPLAAPCGAITFGPFQLLAGERRLQRDGIPVPIGSRALDLLIILVRAGGAVIEKRDLLAQVWPGVVVEESSVRAHIAGLRKALGDDAHDSRYIANVPGRGYCFIAPAARSDEGSGARALSMPSDAAAMPPPLDRIIGRDAVMATLASRLDSCRFLSIIGPGGIGKTTVATALAHRIAGRFERAVHIDLGDVSEAPLVLAAIAAALGIHADTGALLPAILGELHERPTLLLLDSCEHLIDTAAALCERIFTATPLTVLIATSREPLRAEGEYVFRLPALDLPPAHGDADPLQFPAVQMFIERARATGLDTAVDLTLVAHLCRQLDGLPLALELAAARASSFGVAGLTTLLDQRFGLHWQGRRTAHPRHQTMAAMLDWSYQLLPAYERKVLCGLAVFKGQFALAEAMAVVLDAGTPEGDLIDAIDALVAKSLIACAGVQPDMQYRLLDTTRAYAACRPEASADASERQRRHAHWLCAELEQVCGVDLLQFHSRAHHRHSGRLGDLRAALAWACAAPEQRGLAVRLTAAASHLLLSLSLLDECGQWAAAGLARIGDEQAGSRAEMTLQATLAVSMMFTSGDHLQIKTAIERGLTLAQRQHDVPHQLWLLAGLHMLEVRLGDVTAVYAVARRAQALASHAGDPSLQRLSAWMLGMSHHLAGCQDQALRYCNPLSAAAPADAPLRLFGFDQRIRALIVQTRALWLAGFPDQAADSAHLTIAEASRSGNPVSDCLARLYAATVFLWLGQPEPAAAAIETVLVRAGRHGLTHYGQVAACLQGELWVRHGEVEAGVRRLAEQLPPLRGAQHEVLVWGCTRALAEGHAACGRLATARALIDQALAGAGSARFDLPELMRIKAVLMWRADPATAGQAAALLQQAIDLATAQSAQAWAGRCAASLAQLPPPQLL